MSYSQSTTLPHSIPEPQVEEDEFVGGDEDAAAGRRREVLGVAEAAVRVALAAVLQIIIKLQLSVTQLIFADFWPF